MLFTLQRYEFFSKSQLYLASILLQQRCCLPYKGTNFSANHNAWRLTETRKLDVVYPTKVRIFQQITTGRGLGYQQGRCCLPYKGTNFSANHNVCSHRKIQERDVVYPTKVRIFQQITTYSQSFWVWWRCCLPYKGTNFSANHNKPSKTRSKAMDVVYPTKVRIFQQITTMFVYTFSLIEMLFTLQRYEFFSKSQPV